LENDRAGKVKKKKKEAEDMEQELLQEIASYWGTRAEGYSEVNEKELAGSQREAWLHVLEEQFPEKKKEEMCVLPIRAPLLAVLDSIVAYLYAKMQCKHMHLIKQQEVLLVLRGYYTKKELFTFFSSILGHAGHFEDFVMDNYRKVKSVKEFAGLYCTSERSFNRKFRDCFKESPYQWMQKKKAELIREKISESDTPFQEIAMDFDFNSQAHFTSYCKRLFGMTPSKLRTESKRIDASDLGY